VPIYFNLILAQIEIIEQIKIINHVSETLKMFDTFGCSFL